MLSLMSVLTCLPSSGQESPREVLDEFCQMDAQGMQLTREGLRRVNALFTEPRESLPKRSVVVRDFVVSRPAVEGSKARFFVEYVYLGQLDEEGPRFSRLPPPYPPQPIKVRVEYTLSQNGQASGSIQWKIDGAPHDVHISVGAAIKHLEQLRAQARTGAIARNADRAIASLQRLR
jgi:hypothetical protein